MSIKMIDKLASLLPTTTAKISLSITTAIAGLLYAKVNWVVTKWPHSISDPQLLLSLLGVIGLLAIGMVLALVSVTKLAYKTKEDYDKCKVKINKAQEIINKEKKSELKYYSHSDSSNIKIGVVAPIQLFENGEFSAPGDILCDEHRMTLEHIKDRHFCSEVGCLVELNMTEREQVLSAAEKLANRDIYRTLNTIPVEVDTYSHGIRESS